MKTYTYNYRSGQQIIPEDIVNGVVQTVNGLDYSI